MIHCAPITLEAAGIRLEPLTLAHEAGLQAAALDGELYQLWYTSVPHPDEARAYIERALATQDRLPWAVRELATDTIVGSTSFHDIARHIDRVEIGYTWYRQSRQRTSLNTTCKLMLFAHAFETLGCKVVGLRTDNFNFPSQRAIEALGAKKDGVIRHHFARRDGSVRDTVMYSVLQSEWPDVQRHLQVRLLRHGQASAQ